VEAIKKITWASERGQLVEKMQKTQKREGQGYLLLLQQHY
jgi:hypothetical protein